MMVYKVFFMSTESGLGRSIMCKQGKSNNQKKYLPARTKCPFCEGSDPM